jgi:hypothetical protein
MKPNFNHKFHDNAIRIEPGEWFNDAIIGTTTDRFLIYSYYRLVQVHMRYMNETEEDSRDWIDINCMGLTCDSHQRFKVSFARKYIWKEYKPSCLKGLRKRK